MRKIGTESVWAGGADAPGRTAAVGAGVAVGAVGPRDVAKRSFDIVLAAVLLIPAGPLMLLAAVAIRIESPGPVLFRQTRIGRDGQRFRILKLRTLKPRSGAAQVVPGDPRVTRVGHWLRRTSLDELPQLVNVLRGEMSLVGPRPHALRDDLRFRRLQPGYAARRQVRPGLTGWAQVNGCRGAVRQADDLYRRTRHDLAYLAGRSLAFDLRILLRTVGAVVRGAAA